MGGGAQEALNLTGRVHAASKYGVSACSQKLLACNRTAPSVDFGGINATSVAAVLNASRADAIIISGNSSLPNSISFDASSDPGAFCFVYLISPSYR